MTHGGLSWPAGWPRTKRRERSRFNVAFAVARDALFNELRLMGARYPVLSANIPLRRDGLPYANTPEPSDPGVAVYFEWKGRQMTFACDRWDRVRDNVQAIRKTIEAIRGIERWGASDMMERAFSAFEALPSPESWQQVLDVPPDASAEDVKAAYRQKALECHPDQGGSPEAWERLRRAYEAGQQATAATS